MKSIKSFLASNWEYIVIGIAVILVMPVLWMKFSGRTEKDIIKVDNPLLTEQVKTLRDENGKLYAQLEQKVYTQAQVTHLLDSVAKTLKIKVKQIKGMDKIVFKTDTIYKNLPSRPIFIVHSGDTAYQVERHDGWNDIVATAGPDSGSIVFRSRDTLVRIEIAKTPIIGPTKRYIYLTNTNPSVQIKEGAAFTIKEKQPWLVIGPYAGYDPFTQKASVGVGITVPIITLKR